jgi:RimJ/RimL family protein N-acetyltransferase
MSIELIAVSSHDGFHIKALYDLLGERTPEQSISHKEMPSWEGHVAFVKSKPYRAWYFIFANDIGDAVGATYLTKQNEIGIAIFKAHRGKGYAKEAIQELMKLHDGPFLANINPNNWASRWLFDRLGFKFIQVTYSHD